MDHVMCTFHAGAANWVSLGDNWPLRLGDDKSSPVGCIGPPHVLLTESNPHGQPRLTHAKDDPPQAHYLCKRCQVAGPTTKYECPAWGL